MCVGIMSLFFSQFYQIFKKKLLIIAFDTNSADSKKVFSQLRRRDPYVTQQ